MDDQRTPMERKALAALDRVEEAADHVEAELGGLRLQVERAKERAEALDRLNATLGEESAREIARADVAETRVKELNAANQGWQMVEDERVAFVAASEKRVAALEDELRFALKSLVNWAKSAEEADVCPDKAAAGTYWAMAARFERVLAPGKAEETRTPMSKVCENASKKWLREAAEAEEGHDITVSPPEEQRFQLRLTCCGLKNVWPLQGPGLTWEHAVDVRNSFISVPGHDRQAIVEPYKPAAPKEGE